MSAAANVQLLCSLNGKTETKKSISTNRHEQQRQKHEIAQVVWKRDEKYGYVRVQGETKKAL